MNKIVLFLSIVFLIVLLVGCDKKVAKIATPPPTPVAGFCDSIKFNKYIKPIIINNCAVSGCHISGFPSGDFTNYAGLAPYLGVNGGNGHFKLRVFDSPSNPMPSSGMLPQTQLDSIKCWLDKGSPND